VFSDLGILILLGLLRMGTLLLTNGEMGWHRDELDTLANARYLDWGYVSYPPLAPFLARIALTLFGASLTGVRFFATLALAISMVLAGLMAREMGGKRWAQVTAALALAIAPYPMLGGSLFHYSSFDYLWWTVIAYMMIRLLKSDDPRWWLGIGALIGIGLQTKYTIAYLVAGIVVGVLLTRARRYLLSPWLWGGVALALLIVLPNLIWQIQHDFITLDFMRNIHARDVRIGRTEGFLKEQFIFSTNLVTAPVWLMVVLLSLRKKWAKLSPAGVDVSNPIRAFLCHTRTDILHFPGLPDVIRRWCGDNRRMAKPYPDTGSKGGAGGHMGNFCHQRDRLCATGFTHPTDQL
jgi:hypothetical protein